MMGEGHQGYRATNERGKWKEGKALNKKKKIDDSES